MSTVHNPDTAPLQARTAPSAPPRPLCKFGALPPSACRSRATYSHFADGGVGEIFISNHKAGSHLNACVRDLGVAASLALQFGCSLDTLRRALLRNADGSPATALGAALDIISGRAR
jgi:hypothetical protein